MLYIKKTSPTEEIKREIAKLKSTKDWRDLSDDDTDGIRSIFDKLPKDIIRQSLLRDQHYLCAYCMRRIDNDNLTSIEHYKPLSLGKEHALDYSNFLAVCDGGEHCSEQAGNRILCCDASKGDVALNVINPLNPIIMSHITYDRDGQIGYCCSEDQKDAVSTDINKILRLNGKLDSQGRTISDTSTKLVKNRKDAYLGYKKLMEDWDSKGKLTKNLINKTIDKLLKSEKREEYVGVTIFFLSRKLKTLN